MLAIDVTCPWERALPAWYTTFALCYEPLPKPKSLLLRTVMTNLIGAPVPAVSLPAVPNDLEVTDGDPPPALDLLSEVPEEHLPTTTNLREVL